LVFLGFEFLWLDSCSCFIKIKKSIFKEFQNLGEKSLPIFEPNFLLKIDIFNFKTWILNLQSHYQNMFNFFKRDRKNRVNAKNDFFVNTDYDDEMINWASIVEELR